MGPGEPMMGLRKVENREKKTGHKDNFYCHKARKNCPYDRKPLKANEKEATRASLPPRFASKVTP